MRHKWHSVNNSVFKYT